MHEVYMDPPSGINIVCVDSESSISRKRKSPTEIR